MTREISKSRADRLGERLRRADSPDSADLAELQQVIQEYDEPLANAQQVLTEAGFSATSRLKTELTTLEKLKREKNRLSTIQDIAGLRIVLDMDLNEQDHLTQTIVALFEGARVLDRRKKPSAGYRAVHVIAHIDDFPVEVQVRTLFQDLWAQAFERFADLVGRGIRYGEYLEDPSLETIRKGFETTSAGIARIESRETEFRSVDRDFEAELPSSTPGWFPPRARISHLRAKRALRRLAVSKAALASDRTALLQSMKELVDLLSKGSPN